MKTPGVRSMTSRTLLLLCASLTLTTSCKEEAKHKIEERVERAKENVAKVKQNVAKVKAQAKELPDRLIADARARSLLELSDEEFAQKVQDNLVEIQRYDEGLSQIMALVHERDDLFPDGMDAVKPKKSLSAKQREELRQLWAGTLDYMRALDGVKHYWSGFHRINAITQKDRHAAAFLVSYAAWMVQYRHGLTFIDESMPNKALEVFLDEPGADIPERSFEKLKWNVVNVKAITRLLGSRHYYTLQHRIIEQGDCGQQPACTWAMARVERYHEEAKGQLSSRAAAVQFSYNAYDIVRDAAFDSWFPVQKNVAEWMGDTKVKRLHQHLIHKEQLLQMRQVMEPADIVVARHNWYISNVGLPGFWPHAELYLSAPEELDAYFAEADLPTQIPNFKGKTLSQHLAALYPEAWAAYSAQPDHDGEAHHLIEAVSEGVVFSSIERGAGADYVGVMRPRRSKLEKARAIIRAFSYWGRPYDFNFDFLTDSSIVCTELVYKAWEKTDLKDGLSLQLVNIMGRDTLPANELVRQFALELERPEQERQLEFVYFLDGREHDQGAVIGDADSFSKSCERPKWDVVQQ